MNKVNSIIGQRASQPRLNWKEIRQFKQEECMGLDLKTGESKRPPCQLYNELKWGGCYLKLIPSKNCSMRIPGGG